MTIYEIAKLAGTSISTVSRVLNEKPGVKPQIRQRVEKIITENNYQPSIFAQGLMKGKAKTIGVVMPGVNEYFSRRIDAIHQECKKRGYNLLLTANYAASAQVEDDIENINTILNNKVEAMIYFATRLTGLHKDLLKEISTQIPLIVTDNLLNNPLISQVIQNNQLGMMSILNYVYQAGHRQIGFIKGPYYDGSANQRFSVYQQFLRAKNLELNDKLIREGNYSIEGGYKATCEILAVKELLPTVLVCCNDHMAIGALNAVREAGYQIPEDISVTGYDDLEITRHLFPPLTTVTVDQYQVGRNIAELIFFLIENKESTARTLKIDPELRIRKSVKIIKNKD